MRAAGVLVKQRLPKPTTVFDTFWRFAAERHDAFLRRVEGNPPPWTRDPIIQRYKFTNVYRAADRVSQYLIRNVIYAGRQSHADTVFRILLFKTFNLISTWELLEREAGNINCATYDPARYDDILMKARSLGKRIYSGAYIMPSGKSSFGAAEKHRNHLRLLSQIVSSRLADRLAESKTLDAAYRALRQLPTIGSFLGFQYAIDINYSTVTNFDEMSFVVPGPGALDGLKKCFADPGDFSEAEIIQWVADQQEDAFKLRGLRFKGLWGRPLQLIDCQNLFCEISKYARVAHPNVPGISGRVQIKQHFKPRAEQINYWFPPKWGLNERITQWYQKHDPAALQRALKLDRPLG